MNINITLFLFTSFLLVVTPGPGVVYVVAHSLRLGRTAGIISALSVNFGSYGLIIVAAYGFTELVAQYPQFLNTVQLCGGLYVCWIAYKMWPRDKTPNAYKVDIEVRSNVQIFKNGVITTLLNPKDILFYAAYIPSFLSIEELGSSYRSHFIALAFIYALMGLTTKCVFALFCSQFAAFARAEGTVFLNYFSTLILWAVGVLLVGEVAITLTLST